MVLGNPYAKYKQNSVMTASPEELTLMLYNGAIKFIKQGKVFIDQNNIEKSHVSITKAQNIISELNATLNMNYEISNKLRSLYTFIVEKLIEANINKDKEILDEVLPLVIDIRDTWQEAMKKAKTEKTEAK